MFSYVRAQIIRNDSGNSNRKKRNNNFVSENSIFIYLNFVHTLTLRVSSSAVVVMCALPIKWNWKSKSIFINNSLFLIVINELNRNDTQINFYVVSIQQFSFLVVSISDWRWHKQNRELMENSFFSVSAFDWTLKIISKKQEQFISVVHSICMHLFWWRKDDFPSLFHPFNWWNELSFYIALRHRNREITLAIN